MRKIDNIRSNQNIRQNKKETKSLQKQRARRRRSPAFNGFVITLKVMVSLFFVAAILLSLWIYKQIDFSFGDDLQTFDLKLTSNIYIEDENGQYIKYDQFKSSENRLWVDIENVPQNLKDAFVAIEDERFYSHNGMDLKRTLGAVFNVFVKGDSSYGGSTITQQLVKNLTKDNERTSARKFREITRSMVLESKFSKDEILELYINSIYLSQGVYGVQAASYEYFGKPVSELNLTECTTIAGITQYPRLYDPITNPENNRKKRETILKKMYELKYIDDTEYWDALNQEPVLVSSTEQDGTQVQAEDEVQSYFTDFMFEQVKADLIKEFGYPDQYAENLIFNGGLKIYSTMDYKIQQKVEDYYLNAAHFPNLTSEALLQSAIVIEDPHTGQVKAVVGGRGKKEDARVLNRATQSKRQPGSTIKPIAVYAPALEENVVNLSSYIDNSPITIGTWRPQNANGNFSGPVPIQTAVSWSYNMPAIRVLQALTVDTSFEYLNVKMHIKSIVGNETKGGSSFTDKTLPSLALGGLTNGVTPLEMSAAYSCIANGGTYIEPSSYTKIYDKHGNILIDKEKTAVTNRVFSEETAFLTRELLKGVVRNGTAAGSIIPGMDTCGKTGTTDENKDKWFIGFTPYYCATVWVGYDSPRVISTGSNPAIKIWKDIMKDIHSNLANEAFTTPSGITKARICGYTGKFASGGCGTVQYADKSHLIGYCGLKHPDSPIKGSSYYQPTTLDEDEDESDEEQDSDTENGNPDENGNDLTPNSTDTDPNLTPPPTDEFNTNDYPMTDSEQVVPYDDSSAYTDPTLQTPPPSDTPQVTPPANEPAVISNQTETIPVA